MPPRFVSPPRPAIYKRDSTGRTPESAIYSEIRVSIGSITQQPINGVDNAYTILGDARASTSRKIPRPPAPGTNYAKPGTR